MTVSMQPVKSGAISAIGYDAQSRDLHVAYAGGGTYIYHDVPEHLATGVHSAASIGRYVMDNIQPHRKFSRKP